LTAKSAANHPVKVKRLHDMIQAQAKINAGFAASTETQVTPVTGKERKRLKASGYTNFDAPLRIAMLPGIACNP